jgi:hypothetical protein
MFGLVKFWGCWIEPVKRMEKNFTSSWADKRSFREEKLTADGNACRMDFLQSHQ